MKNELDNVKNLAGASEKSKLEKLCQLSQETDTLKKQIADKEIIFTRLTKAEETIQILQRECYNNDILRRKLHNDIQDLKGNIRVIARVRPMMKSDNSSSELSPIECSADEKEILLLDNKGRKYNYNYSIEINFHLIKYLIVIKIKMIYLMKLVN